MIDYKKDCLPQMRHAAQLMGEELRNAILNQNLDGLEDRMENYIDMMRAVVKRVRVAIAEELYE